MLVDAVWERGVEDGAVDQLTGLGADQRGEEALQLRLVGEALVRLGGERAIGLVTEDAGDVRNASLSSS